MAKKRVRMNRERQPELRRAIGLAAACVVGLALAHAEPRAEAAESAPTIHLPIERYTLQNGLELILHEDHAAPLATVNLWYHVGSKDEPDGRNGFAHLFEHMMFQGSKHVPEDHYFRYLERVGASQINGTTNSDRTNYFETVPSNRLELALWLESDRMGFLLDHADQKTFAGQREVVKNERRQNYENAPYGHVREFVHAALYPKEHPYHLLTIGTPRDLDAAELRDVQAFFRTWYVPNNATLVVAGDIDKTKTKALVEKYFGPIPKGPEPTRRSVPPVALKAEKRLSVRAGVELPRLYITWATPKMFAPGDAELDLISQVLSNGKTSRLYKRLVYDMQIARDVYAYQASGELGSTFEIFATVQKGHKPAELLKVIDEELAKLRAKGVTGPELARAKTSMTSSLLFELERVSSRANRFNLYRQLAGDPAYVEKDFLRYQTLSSQAVMNVANQVFGSPGRVVTSVTPDAKAPVAGVLEAPAGEEVGR